MVKISLRNQYEILTIDPVERLINLCNEVESYYVFLSFHSTKGKTFKTTSTQDAREWVGTVIPKAIEEFG